jgi:ATP-dependent protease ClpP protease subunit
VIGMAHSIAMLILQAADLRRASPESRLMIHQGKIYVSDAGLSADEMKDHAGELARDNERYFAVLAERSNLSLKEIGEACKKDTYYRAHEALKHGFIDEIIYPHKKVEVTKLKEKTKKKPTKATGRKAKKK